MTLDTRGAVTVDASGRPIESEEAEFVDRISDDPDLQTHFEELLERTKDASGEAVIRMYQVPTDSAGNAIAGAKGMAWLFSIPLDRMGLDELFEKVRTEFLRPHEDSITVRMICSQKGRRGMLFNRLAIVKRGAPSPSAEPKSGESVLAEVGKMLAAQQAQMQAMFARFAAPQLAPVPAVDTIGQFTALIGALSPIMAAAAGRPPVESHQSSMKEMFEMLTMARQLVSGGPIKGLDADEDSFGSIAKTIFPTLPALINALKSQPALAAPAAPAAPPRLPVPPAPTLHAIPTPAAQPIPPAAPFSPPEPPTPTGSDAVFNDVVKNLGDLADLVEANRPENMATPKIAEMVANSLPEELPPQLDGILFAPDAFEQLATLQPKLRKYPEWWTSFLDELKKIYSA